MKIKTLLLFILLLQGFLFAQPGLSDPLLENSIYTEAPEEIRQTKPFMREWWFYEQRSYPNDIIPENAYMNSLNERDQLRLLNGKENIPTINWVSLGPTPGAYFGYGNISSRVVTGTYDPNNANIIYIGPANGGVWKSTDGGTNWTPLTDQEVSMAMGSIVVDPNNSNIIYAGTGEATYSGASYYGRGLLKSTDGGNSWTNYTTGLPTSTYFSRLVIQPGNSQYLLAALGNAGLYRSTNGGVSWNALLGGRCDDVVYTSSGDTAFAVGSGVGLRRSIDGGVTFSSFGTGLINSNRTHFDLCKSNPAFMYAAVYGGSLVRIYKSTNYGANWSELSTTSNFKSLDHQAWYDLYCRVNPQNPNKAYVGTIDVFRSTDGTNFSNITNGYAGGSVHVDQHFLFFHPTDENTFIVCNDGGIWKTTNNGSSFTNMNQNLTLTQFYRIKASPFTPSRILGGTQDNGTQQTFAALNWAAAYGGDGGEVSFNLSDSNYILGETQYNGVFRTTNGGVTWNSAQSGLSGGENAAWVGPIEVHPTTSGTFYTARQRVYRSTNNGGSWTAISGNINGSSSVRELTISKSNPSIMFATSGSQVFKSTDAGATWSNVTSGLPNRTITTVEVHPTNSSLVFLTFSGFGTDKVYKSTNGGSSWSSIDGPLPDSPVNDIYIATDNPGMPNTYFVATDIGVFITEDDGANWTEVTNGLPNTVIIHLDYSPSNKMLRAGTHGRGVYEAYIDFIIPVELTSFAASVSEQKVLLNWSTATETNNSGFAVERKLKNQEWESVGNIPGAGTTTEIRNYSFEDDFSFNSYDGTLLYRLKQMDYDGTFEYSDVVAVDVNFKPTEYKISQNYPNPFNPTTTITYSVVEESNVRIFIFNSLGERVDVLVNSKVAAGNHQVSWNAEEFPSGVYLYSFEVEDGNGATIKKDTKKLILMK